MRTTATPETRPAPATEPPARTADLRRRLVIVAGPTLIVVSVLIALRGFIFSTNLTSQHPDILSFILPRLSFLGRSLASGRVPLWNPFDMGGTPYVADPQSGWLYLSPMVLFSTLSPGAAMRAYIVVNPLLAGLGLYAFLRIERLSRPVATIGGLSLALAMASSTIAVSLPFAGAMAWTTVVLIGAAGYVRADRWSRRTLWLGVGALAWGQVAGAHMSHGLGMATLLVGLYLFAAAIQAARDGESTGLRSALLGALFLAILPLANLAILLPHLSYISRSSLQGGYAALGEPLGGSGLEPIMANGVWSGWPLALGAYPGAYVGALVLICVPLALRATRLRSLAAAFAAAGLLAYALTLNVLVTAEWFRTYVLQLPFGDVYLHNPGRLRYLAYLTVPVLGAIGVQGLLDRPPDRRRALRWLGAGAALWLGLPLLFGARPANYLVLGLMIAVSIPMLVAFTERRRWAMWGLPALLVLELTAGALGASLFDGGPVYTGLESGERANLVPTALRQPWIPQGEFLGSGAIARFLRGQDDRYLTWAPPASYFVKGYLWTQRPSDWPALENERGTLFGAPDVLGYNPVQLPGYWSYIRSTNRLRVFYNASVINLPTIEDLRLLGVRYLIVPEGVAPPVDAEFALRDQGYNLWSVREAQPRASLVTGWEVVGGPSQALRRVVEPGFDPAERVILEQDPGIGAPLPETFAGTAQYREVSPERVVVQVDARTGSMLLVRNNFDEGWSATVDGRTSPVLRADAFRQAVAVGEGKHEVILTYRDPSVGRGLAASGVAWATIVAGGLASLVLERRRRPGGDLIVIPDDEP